MLIKLSLKPCPHCRRKVRLSHKSETVSLFCDSVHGQAISFLVLNDGAKFYQNLLKIAIVGL